LNRRLVELLLWFCHFSAVVFQWSVANIIIIIIVVVAAAVNVIATGCKSCHAWILGAHEHPQSYIHSIL